MLTEFYKKTKKKEPKVTQLMLLTSGKLNKFQRMAIVHGLDLHASIPAKGADLPPLALQWKQAYGGKSNG